MRSEIGENGKEPNSEEHDDNEDAIKRQNDVSISAKNSSDTQDGALNPKRPQKLVKLESDQNGSTHRESVQDVRENFDPKLQENSEEIEENEDGSINRSHFVPSQKFAPKKRKGIWKSLLSFSSVVILAVIWVLVEKKAKDYLNETVLPPIVLKASKEIGREINLGKIKSLSPLGAKIGPTSIGPANDEFSCAEIAEIELKVSGNWEKLKTFGL